MKIEILYPEVCNLFGDLANIRFLKKNLPEAVIIETSLKNEPAFVSEKVDLIYMGTTTEEGIRLAVKALTPYKEKLNQLVADGQFILLTGNAQDVFMNYVLSDEPTFMGNEDPKKNVGLGIIDAHCDYHMMGRHNSFYIGKFEGFEVVGFKSIFGHAVADGTDAGAATVGTGAGAATVGAISAGVDPVGTASAGTAQAGDETVAPGTTGWFETVRGVGSDPKTEGFKVNNLYATCLIGPLLLLNPDLTKWVIWKMKNPDKSQEKPELEKITLKYEEAAVNAYKVRLGEMKNEHFDPDY